MAFVIVPYWILMPYSAVCMIKVYNRKNLGAKSQNALVALVVFQFVMLLPMFTVLSCDILRVGIYWMMSSTIIWLSLSSEHVESMFSGRFKIIAERISAVCFNRWLPGKTVLTLFMLFLGIPVWVGGPEYIIRAMPIVRVAEAIQYGFIKLNAIISA